MKKRNMKLSIILILAAILLCGCIRIQLPKPGGSVEHGSGTGIIEMGPEGSDGLGDAAASNDSDITYFRYSYNGTIGGGSFTYEICSGAYIREWKVDEVSEEDLNAYADDQLVCCIEEMEHYHDYGALTMAVDAEFMQELKNLYIECGLAGWDGFDKVNKHVLDGDGFSLDIEFADGESLRAYGSNAYPKGYGDAEKRIMALFGPLRKQMAEERIARIIAKGTDSDLDFVMFYIHQSGASGHDEYNVLLSKNGVRDHNIDVVINSVSGEYWPEGRYRYFTAVDDSELDFDAVQDMIDRYDIIQWYDYEKIAEDYQNAEFFQISFSYEDNFTISACGSDYPEHYAEFRQEFLTWLKELLKDVEEYE